MLTLSSWFFLLKSSMCRSRPFCVYFEASHSRRYRSALQNANVPRHLDHVTCDCHSQSLGNSITRNFVYSSTYNASVVLKLVASLASTNNLACGGPHLPDPFIWIAPMNVLPLPSGPSTFAHQHFSPLIHQECSAESRP